MKVPNERHLPLPAYDGTLPIHAVRTEIETLLTQHQVVILCGETGSGKTTQIPKFCLGLGRGRRQLIGCTQPRRMAARSVAVRLARELGVEPGSVVGYQVRFHEKTSPATAIKVMTDGVLLSEIHGDPLLKRYDTLVVDEAHERSLNIDFLLGYLKRLLPRRPDLKVIITSATLEAERLSAHFEGAPVMDIPGRTFPVEIRWRPPSPPGRDDEEPDSQAPLLDAVDELMRESDTGDLLVFLPGEREIREAAEALRKHHPPHTEILPLFARQSFEEQDRVFFPSGGRRIVLSTNVAETSLTVPGIRYVVDSGLARVNRYSVRLKITQLLVEKISRASARQRAGRCGRVAPGICIRLYDERDIEARPEHPTPEILRTSLAAVILRMEALGLGALEDFPFLDPPSPRAIEDGFQLLQELGALDPQRQLTPTGKELSRLPVDPRIGRMLLAAHLNGALTEALIIVSALSVQDPRERPVEHRQAADQKHARFDNDQSDFLSYVSLWHYVEESWQHRKSWRKWREFCHREFLSFTRLREWRDVHQQLHQLVVEMGMSPNTVAAPPDMIHRALLTGLLGHVGLRDPESEQYMGPRGVRFRLHPASRLLRRKPQWVMAAEMTETTRLYARYVARIQTEWIEPLAGPLLRRSYSDPHWDDSSAQSVWYEKVTLYGLPVVAKRRVRQGPLDPEGARRMFILHALVRGEWRGTPEFFVHNRKLAQEVEALEHTGRRQYVLVYQDHLVAFYEGLLPVDVWCPERLDRWLHKSDRAQVHQLFMERSHLMRHEASHISENLFPDHWTIAGTDYPLGYRFEPGHPLDGVTLTIPLAVLGQLAPEPLEWLVPGLIREKLLFMLKQWPQRLRRELVPLPAFITAFLERHGPDSGSLQACLDAFIRQRLNTRESVTHDTALPAHLLMHIRVMDEEGNELDCGEDLRALQAKWVQQVRASLSQPAATDITRKGMTLWDFDSIPASTTVTLHGRSVEAYPALLDESTSVALQLVETAEEAQRLTRGGILRLLQLEFLPQLKQGERSLRSRPILWPAEGVTPEVLALDLVEGALKSLLPEDCGTIRELAKYELLRQQVKHHLSSRLAEMLQLAGTVSDGCRENRLVMERLGKQAGCRESLEDCGHQLHLFSRNHVMKDTPLEQLRHFPRYLKALSLRLQKIPQDPSGDIARLRPILAWEKKLEDRCDRNEPSTALDTLFWMLQELRVSLFAQILKTPYPISIKRIEKYWESLEN